MTSSYANIFRAIGPLCGEFNAHRWISVAKAIDAELWCFFYLHLDKYLSKQSWGWYLRRHLAHYDVIVIYYIYILQGNEAVFLSHKYNIMHKMNELDDWNMMLL